MNTHRAILKNTRKLVFLKNTDWGIDFPLYGQNNEKYPTTVEANRKATDKYPSTGVGSDGYLQMTMPFPGIAVPDAGCSSRGQK